MVAIINPSAGGGKALQKWNRSELSLREYLGSMTTRVVEGRADVMELVARMISEGETRFIAAGGDGTVNLLLESIMEYASPDVRPNVKLGAVGIGSSNDFQKPSSQGEKIDGIPCRINFDSTVLRDVGVLVYEDDEGDLHRRYWIVNASVGVTAEANLFFNRYIRVMNCLKQSVTNAAILYAALHTLATYRNREMTIHLEDEQSIQTCVTNLGVVKSPHFSGNFCYDSPFEHDSGRFYVHLCENMPMLTTLLTLRALSRRKFSGLPLTRSWRSRWLTVRSDQPFAVEFDGEVTTTRCASFSVIQKGLQVCT
ncbi:MAG: diacylglycerol/lipid kinase family protein [Bacteroidota bacterium]